MKITLDEIFGILNDLIEKEEVKNKVLDSSVVLQHLINRMNCNKESEVGKYVIVRTYSAGVFAGYLTSRTGKEVVLRKARRLWSWDGAASLSQLAVDGTCRPDKCKFPCEVDTVMLLEAIEVLDVTEKARISIKEVPVWKA